MADEEEPQAPDETPAEDSGEGSAAESEDEVEVPLEFGAYKDDGSLNPAYGDPLEVQDRVESYKADLEASEDDGEGKEDPNPPESPPYEEDPEAHAVYAAEQIINQPPPTEPGIPAVWEPEEGEEGEGVEGDEAMEQPIVDQPDPAEETPDEEPAADEPPAEDAGYDPADHTVAEVQDHVDANPDEAQGILAAEQANRNRSTLVSWLQDFISN